MNRFFLYLALYLGCCLPAQSWAGDATIAIENRKYTLHHELMLGGVLLPQNSFYKAAGVELSYTLHLSNAFAWEPIRASLTTSWNTPLRKKLVENWNAEPEEFEIILQQYSTQFHFKPFYGKFSVLNKGLVRAELYFLGGTGLTFSTWRIRLHMSVGVGVRTHLGANWSLRLELAEQLILGKEIEDNIAVHLGVARNFR
jgi:outer membrane beta-barrel protein